MSSTVPTYPQALEGIRATISAYSQGIDDGRIDAVAELFCPDGELELPTIHLDGREAIFERLSGPRPAYAVRHLVFNHLVTNWDTDRAQAVSDLVVLNRRPSGWVIDQVGRYFDTLHHRDGLWRFHTRKLVFLA